ncbi:hypothetical protein D8674_004582 [Pyrus ussuriensis x Pyrus communis]|uniref:Uncharacterized protein n=1 Tax=Pyrus ussuriensis x Pyrus communis TaxID=2448454 RepID=A0A5N5FL47_9ROSA|nr:hypothetical protein D8674_004582 [Pyrus ussuriensis x Pyrus communis]
MGNTIDIDMGHQKFLRGTKIVLVAADSVGYAAHSNQAILRGYSKQRVLKEGMFEDLSLAKKQLRFVLRFLMVCLLLNRREMVWQLLNQLKVLVDECKRTFQLTLMYFCAAMGNENGSSYPKELPPNFDISGTEKFIRAKYEGKLWVVKNAKQPVPLLILICEGARAFPQTDIVLLDERWYRWTMRWR